MVDIYTDGSYDSRTKRFGSAAVFVKDGEIVQELSFGGDEEFGMNNVTGEIEAAIRGIRKAVADGEESAVIHCDYEGVKRWAELSWKRNKPATQAYAAFVSSARKSIRLSFVHVDGHSGDVYNERADRLAFRACREPDADRDDGETDSGSIAYGPER